MLAAPASATTPTATGTVSVFPHSRHLALSRYLQSSVSFTFSCYSKKLGIFIFSGEEWATAELLPTVSERGIKDILDFLIDDHFILRVKVSYGVKFYFHTAHFLHANCLVMRSLPR